MNKPDVEYFEGEDGQHYWRLRAGNGQIVAVGGEGYSTERGARRGFARTRAIIFEIVSDAYAQEADELDAADQADSSD